MFIYNEQATYRIEAIAIYSKNDLYMALSNIKKTCKTQKQNSRLSIAVVFPHGSSKWCMSYLPKTFLRSMLRLFFTYNSEFEYLSFGAAPWVFRMQSKILIWELACTSQMADALPSLWWCLSTTDYSFWCYISWG